MFGKILMRYKLEDTHMLRCISRRWHVSSVFFSLFFNFLIKRLIDKKEKTGFPGGAVVESLPANAGDTGSSPGLGRSHMPWSN